MKRYNWIAISFEETNHQECSFQEYCLYDMANIETTSSVLGWDCPDKGRVWLAVTSTLHKKTNAYMEY